MADSTITGLPAGAAATGGPIPTVQAGTTVKITATAAGATILEAASAAAQRTALGLGTAATLDFDTDGTLAANSDSKIATQKATKTYVDTAVTSLLDFKGSIDASGNPNYPAASKGDFYIISVAGKIGGASGLNVDIGDAVVANADNAGGTQAAVGAFWFILEHNLQGALLAANNLSDVASAATSRTNLGLAIGTNVQAWDADLDAIAALVSAADKLPYATGAQTWAMTTLTSLGRSFIAAATAAAAFAVITPLTTKGDILGFDTASNRVPIGTNGQVLTADSTTSLGLKWATPTTGTVTSVATGTGLTGGPITSSGTISLADTAVTPGSYTLASITVDQQGRLTSAATGTVSLTTQVTGVLPIANGGTNAATAAAAIANLSPLTTKGDLLGFSTVNARVPVGTDGFYLVADSTQTLGVKWAANSATIGGSIATNQVAYGSGTNAIQGSAALTFDGTTLATTGIVSLASGSAGAPSLAFTAGATNGWFLAAANNPALATNGVQRFDVSTTAVTSTLPWRGPNGTVSLPGMSFSGDSDTGAFLSSSNQYTIVTGGAKAVDFTPTQQSVFAGQAIVNINGTVSAPALGFGTTSNFPGFYATSTTANLSINLVQAASWSTTAASTFLGTVTTPAASTGAPQRATTINSAAHTALTASTEYTDWSLIGVTQQFATGALATQRYALFTAPTYAFVGASTITTAATVAISAAPVQGTNATITVPLALWTQAGSVLFDGAPIATANRGTVNAGNGAIDGATSGFFVGSASGTVYAANVASTYAGNMIDLQNNGKSIFNVTSVSGAQNGITIIPGDTTNSAVITVVSPNTNNALTIRSKGTSSVTLSCNGGSTSYAQSQSSVAQTNAGRANLTTAGWKWTRGTDTNMPTTVDVFGWWFANTNTTTHANGSYNTQTDFLLQPSTQAFTSVASVITDAIGMCVQGSTNAGTNATITNSHGAVFGGWNANLNVAPASALAANAITGTVTNSMSATFFVQTGATNNIAVRLISAPQASANTANLAIGSGAFDGTTSGFFVGSSSGTQIGINAAAAFAGSHVDFQNGGKSVYKITTVASAVNGFTFTTAATGNGISLAATGTDSNIGLTIASKGTGTIIHQVNGATVMTWGASTVTLADAYDVVLNATTGTKIGTATSQKLGFWNKTPVIQPASANQAALVNNTTGSYDGTLVDVGVVFSQAAINDNFTDVYTLLTEIRTALLNTGLIKGAA